METNFDLKQGLGVEKKRGVSVSVLDQHSKLEAIVGRSLTRRSALRMLVGASVGSVLLAACGGDDDDEEPTSTEDSSEPSDPTEADAEATDEATTEAEEAATDDQATEAETSSTDEATSEADEAATDEPAEGDVVKGGTLRVAVTDTWRVLDPPLYANITDRHVYYSIYDALVAMTEDLAVEPALAHTWEVSSDALVWTFSLNEGIAFHDGTEFNAEAAKFNLDRLLNPETGSRLRREVLDISEVIAVDAVTLEVHLSQPFTPLLSWFADVPGMMSSPTAIQERGSDYASNPVGTGPFKFVEQVQDDHLTLARNENYWQPDLPHVDEVIYRPVPDDSVKVSALRSDSFEIANSVPAQDVESLESEGFQIYALEGSRWPMVYLNTGVAPLDNKLVRQALSLAVNRDSIVQAVYFGGATPAHGPISPLYREVYDPEIEEFGLHYNPELAKERLAEAGFADGFSFTLDVSADSVRTGELIQADLAAIGVDLEVIPYEGQAAFDKAVSGDFEAFLGSFTPRPDPDGTLRRNFYSESEGNYSQYNNPRVDELLDQERLLPLGAERVEAFREMQRLIVDDAPWIFLVFESVTNVMAPNVRGFRPIPDTLLRTATIWLDTE